MSQYLFSYGTLQAERVQIELFGRILSGTADSLRQYRVMPVKIRDRQFLERGEDLMQMTLIHTHDNNDVIRGAIYEVSDAELILADQYEPDNYKRKMVELDSGRSAWIYLAVLE